MINKQDFYDGKMFDAYKYMGAHLEGETVRFTTYAPNAEKISIVGDFNHWMEEFMLKENQSGFFSFVSSTAKTGQMYKYRIYGKDGSIREHCDPYGFEMELRPGCCTIIRDLSEYEFHDEEWMKNRTVGYSEPINIYEMHLGSWKTKDGENEWYQYDELAGLLIPYLKENHYTHVEFIPLSEHPFDGSWGYQNTGFFAPTKRYGTANQLMYLVDSLHKAGIGVIMDFVLVHFARDAYGLSLYDGTPLYEYPSSDVGESEWGSCNFIHSRREIQCFLQSAANYWLTEYHFDGLRMDAVSRLIYWQGDNRRGENTVAIAFLKNMNAGLKKLHPTAMLIAEDSTTYPSVTKPVEENGLGFDYKWDLGWMHDTLEYFQSAPIYRIRDYHKLTFSMMYFYNEKFLLEYSHDEVVHGKATILQKMYGDYEDKFPQARAMYLYMMMHPGKKLNFMGNEFGQLREWDEKREQDWGILKYPLHDSFHKFMIELNRIYQTYNAFHSDYLSDNFRWIDCHQEEKCIYSIERKGSKENVVAIFNFSDELHTDYSIKLSNIQTIEVLMHSDWQKYGGNLEQENNIFHIEKEGLDTILSCDIERYSGILLLVIKSEETKS